MGVNGYRRSGALPRRAWYPSGPWVDGVRPPGYDSDTSTTNTKTVKRTKSPGNPDPTNYKVVQAKEVGKHLVLKIKYPDCTNYEGEKILVFKDLQLIDLINQKVIDPHFFEDKKLKSPIARFVPTDEGWKMAVKFAEIMKEVQL